MKKDNSLLIVIIVFLAVALGVVGGILITKLNDNKPVVDDSSNNSNQDNTTDVSNNYIKVNDDQTGKIIISKEYVEFVEEYKTKRQKIELGRPECADLFDSNQIPISNIKIDKDGRTTLAFNDLHSIKKEYPNGYTLKDNYLFGKAVEYGNAGFYYYLLIDEDGILTKINGIDDSDTEYGITIDYKWQVNSYKELTDIKQIEGVDYCGISVIDINNKEFIVY